MGFVVRLRGVCTSCPGCHEMGQHLMRKNEAEHEPTGGANDSDSSQVDPAVQTTTVLEDNDERCMLGMSAWLRLR